MRLLKVKPHVTEKTLKLAREKQIYTFVGLASYTKSEVKEFLEKMFNAKVKKIRVAKIPAKQRFNFLKRRHYTVPAREKFYVTFEGNVKIPGFNLSTK